jgi:nitrile hydratase beta subunit
MHGFGPVILEPNEPVFHADWERRTFALALATMGAGRANVDEFRHATERMEPAHYLASSYYEHWLHAIETVLTEKGIIGAGEIDSAIRGNMIEAAREASVAEPGAADAGLWSNPDASSSRPRAAAALRYDPQFKARFKPGDRIIVRNLNPAGHTRAPRYVRGHRGVIRRDWGVFVFPDTHAHGLGTNPRHCYAVEFTARELWGPDRAAGERIYVDLWDNYIDFEATAGASIKKKPARLLVRMRPVKAPVVKSKNRKKPVARRRASSRAQPATAGTAKKRR